MQETKIAQPVILTAKQLAAQVHQLIATPAQWVARVRLDTDGRWYEQITRQYSLTPSGLVISGTETAQDW
jgi:hypothetical protein